MHKSIYIGHAIEVQHLVFKHDQYNMQFMQYKHNS